MNYKEVYDKLVSTRKYRGTRKQKGDGFNRHHIIPKCLGGNNDSDNIVLLTFKEHIVAHHLLHLIYPQSKELTYAFLRMIQSSHSDRKENRYKTDKYGKSIPFHLSIKELDALRNQSIQFLREKNTGKRHSEDTKKKLREAHLGKKASEETKKLLSEIRTGHTLSIESRKKLSESRKGIVFSQEHRTNISKSRQGIKLSEETKQKISGEKSFNSKKIIGPTGEIYNTISECCNSLGMTRNTFISRLKKDKSFGYRYKDDNQNILKTIKIIDPTGKIYNSLKDCSRSIGRSRSTIKRWLDDPSSGYKRL